MRDSTVTPPYRIEHHWAPPKCADGPEHHPVGMQRRRRRRRQRDGDARANEHQHRVRLHHVLHVARRRPGDGERADQQLVELPSLHRRENDHALAVESFQRELPPPTWPSNALPATPRSVARAATAATPGQAASPADARCPDRAHRPSVPRAVPPSPSHTGPASRRQRASGRNATPAGLAPARVVRHSYAFR